MFNLARSLDRNAGLFPDTDAVIYRDIRLTHGQLLERVSALAAGLRAAGVGKGDVVALLMSNRPEFLESALAVNRIGAAFLSLNVRLAEPELDYIIRHSGAVAIVTEPAFAAPVTAIAARMTSRWTVVTISADPVPDGGDRCGEGGLGHDGGRAGVPDDVLKLRLGQPHVERQEGRAKAVDRQRAFEELGAVGHEQRHDVALTDARLPEGGGERADPVEQP